MNFIFIYTSYWMLSLLLSTFNPYGLYEVTAETYMIMLVNVFSFILGFSVIRSYKKYKEKSKEKYNIQYKIESLINSKVWTLIVVFYFFFVLFLFNYQKEKLLFYQLSDIARDIDLLFEDLTGWYSTVYKLFVPTITSIISFLFAYMILYYRKYGYLLFYFVCVVLKAFIGGSRVSILMIAIYVLTLYILRDFIVEKKRQFIPLKRKVAIGTLITVFGISLYIFMAYATALRKGEVFFTKDNVEYGSEVLNENFVTYSTGPFRAFDRAMKYDYLSYIGGYQYGRSTFVPFEAFISMFSNRLGFEINTISEKTFDRHQNEVFAISNTGILWNYAYTNAIYHYYDLGIFGIIIFSFMTGLFFRLSINLMYSHKSIASMLLVSFLFYAIMNSVFTWYINNSGKVFYLIVLFIWDWLLQYKFRFSFISKKL